MQIETSGYRMSLTKKPGPCWLVEQKDHAASTD